MSLRAGRHWALVLQGLAADRSFVVIFWFAIVSDTASWSVSLHPGSIDQNNIGDIACTSVTKGGPGRGHCQGTGKPRNRCTVQYVNQCVGWALPPVP